MRCAPVGCTIDLPLRNEPLGPWTIDCLWPHYRVAVELDGRQHDRPNQADSDDDRDLWLRRNRYMARRYGTKQMTARPDDVIADLEDAFAQAVTLGYAASGNVRAPDQTEQESRSADHEPHLQ